MNTRRWVIGGTLAVLGWTWLGVAPARAGVIPPTDQATLKLMVASPVTLSLYQLNSTLPAAVTSTSPSRCTTTATTGPDFYKDVTDCWLPEWTPANGGKSVFVVVNGSTAPPTLVPPAGGAVFPVASVALNPFLTGLTGPTTSAYPGQCTNFGSGTEADFELLPPQTLSTGAGTSVTGYELKPRDCGGMAVIQVDAAKFILPKDGTDAVPANG